MTSLADRLKALGVQVGAQNLPPPRLRTRPSPELERVLGGHPLATPQGETFVVEARYPPDARQGRLGLQMTAPLAAIGRWAGAEHLADLPPQAFAFLDTETTGLQGGAGTQVFMVGVGRFIGPEFHLAQFFLRDPIEEPAHLAAVEEFVAPCQAIVSYNGKAFDLPQINTRYIFHGWRPPLQDAAHVDLLHLARRLWRNRLPSRSLGNIEAQILGALRTEEDVPGWMVPSLYGDYLRSGAVEPLKKVFYHNAMDVVSLAALFNHVAGLLAAPLECEIQHAVDLVGLARLYEDLGDIDQAEGLYRHALSHELPPEIALESLERLALLYKRRGDYASALPLWEEAARLDHLPAFEELAKFYEHQERDYTQAAGWTQTALTVLVRSRLNRYERSQWTERLEHRLARLRRKQAGSADFSSAT